MSDDDEGVLQRYVVCRRRDVEVALTFRREGDGPVVTGLLSLNRLDYGKALPLPVLPGHCVRYLDSIRHAG